MTTRAEQEAYIKHILKDLPDARVEKIYNLAQLHLAIHAAEVADATTENSLREIGKAITG